MSRFFALLLLSLGTLGSLSAAAQVPERMQYQGFLKTADGSPVECPTGLDCPGGPYTMAMRLYASPVGGAAFWEETHENVPLIGGLFTLTLGSIEPLLADGLPNGMWLGISINGGAEATPRQQVVSAAFALRANAAGIAQDADALGGLPADHYATKDELPGLCVTPEALTEALANEPPEYTDADVEVVLVDGGYVTLTDLAAVAFTGSYLDLQDIPSVVDKLGINEAGELTFNGVPVMNSAGEWVGAATGLQGPPGLAGAAGQDGADGVSVVSAEVNAASQLVVLLSDGAVYTSGSLKGADGAKGEDGAAGAPGLPGIAGLDGNDGVSVVSALVNSNQELVVTLSDGTIYTSGSLKGDPGDAGGFVDGANPGDTARWDGTQWVVDSALSNTGNGVGILTGTPHPSAALEVTSTTGGFLMPRMTSGERDALLNPTPGLMVFNLTTGCFNHWSGAVWKELCASCEAPFVTPAISGDNAVLCGAGAVTYSVPEIAGANAYTWSIPAGATLVSGQGTSSISVDFGTSAGGNVEVVASGECPNSAPGQLMVGVATTSGSITFEYTGAFQTFTVPPCVNSLSVDLRGGQGGTGSAGAGGLGGQVSGELAVYPGQELYVYVGGQATATGNNAPGGWNGGGNASSSPSAGGGGGASDIRTLSGPWDDLASLESRLLVAAGGGGAGFFGADSRGGGLSSFGKYPASQTAPGQGGDFGKGANALYCGCGYYSGGGGGGWYGGGSYGNSGLETGSGGSSYYGGVGVTQGSTLPGVHSGPGTVTISW